MSDGEERYCICRSTDGEGFMISCDRCEEWFHGRCVGVKRTQSKHIAKWYCEACLKIDSSLNIIYKEEKDKKVKVEIGTKPPQERQSLGKIPNLKTIKDKPSKEKQSPTRFPFEDDYEDRIQQENIPTLDASRVDRQSKNTYVNRSGSRKKRGTKADSHKRQCENPSCVKEARKESNYCSDDCGIELAKKRLVRHFLPKWKNIKENPTEIETRFKKELQDLESSRKYHDEKVHETIKHLEKLDQDIKTIKEAVHREHSEKDEKVPHEDEDDEDNEECEEVTSAEVTKTYCVTCGLTISSDNTFKHWANCFKKAESLFSVSSGCKCTFGTEDNPHPPIFCEYEDTRKKQFCKRFKGICVEHQEKDPDVKKDKDEICGCPLKIQQEIKLDGDYCLEKKSECTSHYQWDKFMKAQLNLSRLHHYFKLDEINEKMRVCTNNLENHYGGIIGLMLHTTAKESKEESTLSTTQESESHEDIDCVS